MSQLLKIGLAVLRRKVRRPIYLMKCFDPTRQQAGRCIVISTSCSSLAQPHAIAGGLGFTQALREVLRPYAIAGGSLHLNFAFCLRVADIVQQYMESIVMTMQHAWTLGGRA